MKLPKRTIARKARILRKRLAVLHTRDFTAVEDSPMAFDIIRELAAKAGKSAAAEAKAAGLSRIFVRNNQIIRLHANGTEEVVLAPLPKGNQFYIQYNAPTVLHAGKK